MPEDEARVTTCGRLALSAEAAALGLPNFSITVLPHVAPGNRVSGILRQLGWIRDRGVTAVSVRDVLIAFGS